MLAPVLGLVKLPGTRWPIVTCICPASGFTSRWPGGARGWPPVRRSGDGCWALRGPGDRHADRPVPPGRRRFGATTRRCGGTRWHAPPTTAKPNSAWPNALARQGRLDEAITHFRRAQQLPIDAAPFNNLGSLFAQQGKLDEAIDPVSPGADNRPRFLSGSHANLGRRAGPSRIGYDEATHAFPPRAGDSTGLTSPLIAAWRICCVSKESRTRPASNSSGSRTRSDTKLPLCNDLASTLHLQQDRFDEATGSLLASLGHRSRVYSLAHINPGGRACRARQTRRGDRPLPPGIGTSTRERRGSPEARPIARRQRPDRRTP